MKTKAVLTDADVSKILAASKAHANKNNWAVTIAVVDDGGHLLGLQRLDGAPAMSAHIAPAKAHLPKLAARNLSVPTHVHARRKGRKAHVAKNS